MFSLVHPPLRIALLAMSLLPSSVIAQGDISQPQVWTIENSIEQVLHIAPEMKTAEALVNAQKGALQQAGAWPNPTLSVQGEDRVNLDNGGSGNDITQYSFSQPLPLSGRLSYQKAIAGKALIIAETKRQHQRLLLEQQTAQRFRQLQLTTAILELAEQRLQLADELQIASKRREEAGELSKLESLRLGLVREEAKQILDKAEGGYNEALSQFRAFLGLPINLKPQLVRLTPVPPIPTLEEFEANLIDQPLLKIAQYRIESAQSSVKLAKSSRWPDPQVTWFQGEDFLNGRKQNFNGISLSITVPLWDRKNGNHGKALAKVDQALSEQASLQRDITSQVKQSYLHLNHLIEQGEHYRVQVFEPAQQVLELTKKAYLAGEVEILSLIDANSTYFSIHTRFLELLQEAWLEKASLQLAVGQSILYTEQEK